MKHTKGIVAPFETCDLVTRIEHWPHALTAPEFADLLGVGKTKIYDLAKRGGIPHYRVAGSIRFDPATTAAWLRQHELAAPERRSARSDQYGPVAGEAA